MKPKTFAPPRFLEIRKPKPPAKVYVFPSGKVRK